MSQNLGWQKVDTDTNDDRIRIDDPNNPGQTIEVDPTGTSFDRNVDLLIGTSLYGYRLNQDIAISALGDLNSSVGSFLAPGTFDVGVGITWTPHQISNLVVVIHPLTYHFAFSSFDGIDSQGAVGAKLKATYSHDFGKGIVWSSNLGAFLPYSNEKFPIRYTDDSGVDIDGTEGLFEYTWINSINIANVWKGVGVGFTYGIRSANFEYPPGIQTYSALGLTYGF